MTQKTAPLGAYFLGRRCGWQWYNLPMFKNKKWLWFVPLVFLIGLFTLLQITLKPSHDRTWELGHEALPQILIDDNEVMIENYRNFTWTGPLTANPTYETRSFVLDDIEGVDVVISHFSDFEGLAHIFLSFRIKDREPVSISLETRREVGEEFSPLLGILRQFEIIYVVGSENDLIGVRTEYRDERVYLYKTKATAEQAKSLFTLLAEDINSVYEKPRMYNTLLRNCTNEITRRVEDMSELDFPLTWKSILPGHFDEVLYDMNIIDTSLPFSETKSWHQIKNELTDPKSKDYSQSLRAETN